jgi:hypothetical protein
MKNEFAKDETPEFLFKNINLVPLGITGFLDFVSQPVLT